MLLGLAVAASPAMAAAGSDNFSDASLLLLSASGSVDTSAFTTQGVDEPAPSASCPAMSHTAWWRIDGNGQPISLTTSGSSFDTVLAVYDPGLVLPAAANRIACNDDDAPATTSAVTFPSVRSHSYLVQVGARSSVGGAVALTASTPLRPANDDRASAEPLPTSTATNGTTIGATTEPGETRVCPEVAGYAATVWYRWAAPTAGDAFFSAFGIFGGVVVTVYRADSGSAVLCAANPTRMGLKVVRGDYLVQVGATGIDAPGLREGPISTVVGFVPDPDSDRDGVPAPIDCDDTNPSIKPGAPEVANDTIDQDCDGADLRRAPKAEPVGSGVSLAYLQPPLRFTKLTILRTVAGSTIDMRCRGTRCFGRRVIHVRTSARARSALRYVQRARLRPGSRVEIRVTKPGTIGFVRHLTVRARRNPPRLENLCIPVGATSPRKC